MLTIPRIVLVASLSACIFLQSCYSLSTVNSVSYLASPRFSSPEPHTGLVRNDIPVHSMRQLLKWYPEAIDINWENAGNALHASFEEGFTSISLDFDEAGNCARAFTRYRSAPGDIQKMVARKYPAHMISSIYSVTTYGEHIVLDYNIVIAKDGLSKVLTWNNTEFRLQEFDAKN